jgi:hypothetical protein
MNRIILPPFQGEDCPRIKISDVATRRFDIIDRGQIPGAEKGQVGQTLDNQLASQPTCYCRPQRTLDRFPTCPECKGSGIPNLYHCGLDKETAEWHNKGWIHFKGDLIIGSKHQWHCTKCHRDYGRSEWMNDGAFQDWLCWMSACENPDRLAAIRDLRKRFGFTVAECNQLLQ